MKLIKQNTNTINLRSNRNFTTFISSILYALYTYHLLFQLLKLGNNYEYSLTLASFLNIENLKTEKNTLIKEIAFALQMYSDNMNYYLKIDTNEIVMTIDPSYVDNPELQKELKEIESNPDNYIHIKPVTSYDAFDLMEGFATKIEDDVLQSKLMNSFSKRKPFAKFKHTVNYFPQYRDECYKYKEEFYENAAEKWLKEHNVGL